MKPSKKINGLKHYKYSGAGNTFVIISHKRKKELKLAKKNIVSLCKRSFKSGADGLIILEPSDLYDFRMRFFNNDGSGGMMCGNGGRCIVDLADRLGLKASGADGAFIFEAPDGIHEGQILSRNKCRSIVSISMRPVTEVEQYPLINASSAESTAFRMNTGTDHLVIFRKDLENLDIIKEGRKWRYDKRFAPRGVNVDFVCSDPTTGKLRMRTYEKGVEAETLACGTGIIAAALAKYVSQHSSKDVCPESISQELHSEPIDSKSSYIRPTNHLEDTVPDSSQTATPANSTASAVQSSDIEMGDNSFHVTFHPTPSNFEDIRLQGPVELVRRSAPED